MKTQTVIIQENQRNSYQNGCIAPFPESFLLESLEAELEPVCGLVIPAQFHVQQSQPRLA
jgi:hypothetical protein